MYWWRYKQKQNPAHAISTFPHSCHPRGGAGFPDVGLLARRGNSYRLETLKMCHYHFITSPDRTVGSILEMSIIMGEFRITKHASEESYK